MLKKVCSQLSVFGGNTELKVFDRLAPVLSSALSGINSLMTAQLTLLSLFYDVVLHMCVITRQNDRYFSEDIDNHTDQELSVDNPADNIH